MKFKFYLIFAFLIIFSTEFISAQTRIITGKITDESSGEALPGVSIILRGTTKGTISDAEGKYNLKVTDSCHLVFSFVGYKTRDILVKSDQTTLDVVLFQDKVELDEVVVVGYGTVTKSDVTGSVTSISDRSTTRISAESALSGKAAGIDVSRSRRKRSSSPKSKDVTTKDKEKVNPTTSSDNKQISSGMLTAGEVNDFSKWKLWNDITTADLKEYQDRWMIKPMNRFAFQLTDNEGYPVIDQAVQLLCNDTVIWSARTDNTGKTEFWANLFDDKFSLQKKYSIRNQCDGKTFNIENALPFAEGMNHQKLQTKLNFPVKADIAFVVDATGSMGDEIEFLKAELNDVIEKVKANHPDLTLNLGSVFYRDKGDEYITRPSPFSTDISQTISFIKQQQAGGGGDFPEAVDSALTIAIEKLTWSADARARLLFLVLDAPPHELPQVVEKMHHLAKLAAQIGIKMIPVAGSGIDKSTEYLMRALALATNGTYTFLTDDSGIGDAHIKPSTDKWDVEFLNALLIRLCNQYLYVPKIEKKKMSDSVINSFSEKPLIMQENGEKLADSTKTDPNISPKKFEFDLNMFPNPTSGELNIKITGVAKELYLADISGKILEKYIPGDQKLLTVDISNYPSGIYFLKYPFNGKWKAGKIVLVH